MFQIFFLCLITLNLNVLLVKAFYVPGVAPQDFSLNDKVEVKVKLKI